VVEMTVKPDKTLTRIDFRFGNIDWERATIKQYELEKELGVWRIFLNGYAKNGFIIFDEVLLPREKVLEALKDFEPEIKAIKRLTVGELIESSYSWNNILGRMES
jgi:antitoxin component of RelBE/YafQ-DinJ toxin-antitoxin module